MKYPRRLNTYCPRCGKHREFTVSLYRKGKERKLAEGARRYARKQKGYGGQRKPRQRKFAKTTKKQTVMIRCTVCEYQTSRLGVRLRRLEITA
jgi:large subunit ribosomal protein L44e